MTDNGSVSRADRLSQADGFALAELLIGTAVLSMLMVLTLRVSEFSAESYYVFPERYTRLKSESLLTGESRSYEDESSMDYPPIRFSGNGVINQARTLTFNYGNTSKEIVIELVTGSLVFR